MARQREQRERSVSVSGEGEGSFERERETERGWSFREMDMESAPGTCQEPTRFYLLGVALRSFFLVLATHLLAGEVDTTLAPAVPLTRRLSWWCRYYNPLNLSWRYYSMFAYRFTAHSWGTHQLALINHEEHPFLPPLPYIVGETVHPLRVRRLEMAGLLSSQGILTFSAAYQGALAIQYAISTEGIPYLPNMTVPLAMVGLFRVMASKWVATKIQVDAYPHPCMPVSPSSTSSSIINAFSTDPSPFSSPSSSESAGELRLPRHPLSLQFSQPLPLLYPSYPHTACSPSPLLHSPSSPQACISPLLPILSYPYCAVTSTQQATEFLPFASERLRATESLPIVSSQLFSASGSLSRLLPSSLLSGDISRESAQAMPLSSSLPSKLKPSICFAPDAAYVFCTCPCEARPSSSTPPAICQVHPLASTYSQPLDYKSNKFVVAGWIGVLWGLVIMSFLPYKVAAAYQLPHRLLQFSMQFFYQYVAVSEFVFHAYLLLKGPEALANRVLFFDHWTFKAQTAVFYGLLVSMLVISLIDFVKNGYYRNCA